MKLLIFGTGSVAEALFDEISDKIEIMAFINTNSEIQEFHGYDVILPERITDYQYDYLVIASGYYHEIENMLLKLGVEKEKIVGFIFDEFETYRNLGKAISDYLNQRYHRNVIRDFLKSDKFYPQIYASVVWKNNGFQEINKDYVREQLMAYMAQEIERKNVPGAVAELGVFRGDFTVVINDALPTRRLWLFDTFSGFGETDVQNDDSIRNKENEVLKFKNTSEEFVLSRLKHRDNVLIVKGWFPDSFELYDEQFCFVSIDMNMYDPVMAALELFVPRVQKGGYILISDFNAPFYEGTRKAIMDFCDGKQLNFLPVPDLYGSAVICI